MSVLGFLCPIGHLTPLSDFIWLLRPGSAGDAQAAADHGGLGGVDGPR